MQPEENAETTTQTTESVAVEETTSTAAAASTDATDAAAAEAGATAPNGGNDIFNDIAAHPERFYSSDFWAGLYNKAMNWLDILSDRLIIVGLLLLIFLIVHFIFRMVLSRAQTRFGQYMESHSEHPGETSKRVKTLFSIVNKVVFIGIWIVAALVSLSTIGVQIGPIIATAGVLGLAVSFGAQSLVKDIISGVFILFENQIRVGDVAVINGTGGLVEQINMRTVVLRDMQGTVHVFPNGSINTLANMTKDWSAAVLDIGVAYKEDPDAVIEVLKELGAEMRADATFGPKIINDIEIMGVNDFADSAVVIRCRLKTHPIEQWNVGREFRKRLKKMFDARGIEIPFPHRTLYFGEASKEFLLAVRDLREKKAEIETEAKKEE